MILLTGARGLGFGSNTNGSEAELREQILNEIAGINASSQNQLNQINSAVQNIYSVSGKILNYLPAWDAIVANVVATNKNYTDWWVNSAKPMQERINALQNTLLQVAEKLGVN